MAHTSVIQPRSWLSWVTTVGAVSGALAMPATAGFATNRTQRPKPNQKAP